MVDTRLALLVTLGFSASKFCVHREETGVTVREMGHYAPVCKAGEPSLPQYLVDLWKLPFLTLVSGLRVCSRDNAIGVACTLWHVKKSGWIWALQSVEAWLRKTKAPA